jgi:hypothetical protein
VAAAIALLGAGASQAMAAAPTPARAAGTPSAAYPWPARVDSAARFAGARRGLVSFAVMGEDRVLRGVATRRRYLAASVVKAMLLVAYLSRPSVADRPLGPGDRRLLAPMIIRSDNDAASRVYGIVGAAGLRGVAGRAGMRAFSPARSWGSSLINAADQARFFLRIDRLVPARHRDYARDLLSSIVASQRWGIPPVSPPGWQIFFKGGWRPRGGWTVGQVALIERGSRRLAVAILTRGNGTFAYGRATVRGVAARLLLRYEQF